MAARRYRRNRLLRSQGIDPDRQSQARGSPKRIKRLLAKDEIQALPVITLTEDDIARSRRLAHRPPSALSPPDAVLKQQARLSMSCPPPPLPEDAGQHTAFANIVAMPASIPLADKSMLTSTGVASHAPELPAIVDNTHKHGNDDDALALSHQTPLHEENCAVCLEDFNAGEDVRRLPCRHYFHIACIDPWLSERAATCPLCNYDVAQPLDT
ncbi:hypothetical protein FBU31_005816, partial [Coemansia sp. 'formosensis']